ncbi:MAG: hypothetical protein QMD96_05595 [Anaerosomatales bacterium]|nr:hypothetical protein [Anaerosomatales bacterium]
MADAFGWKIWTANRRIARAREAGLIPPPEELPDRQEAALRAVEEELHRLGVPTQRTPRRERLLAPDGEGGLSPTRFAVDPRRADIYRRLHLAGMFDEAQEYLRHLEQTAGEDYPTDEDQRFEEIADRTRGALFGDGLKGYLDGIAQRRTEEQGPTQGGGDDA